MNNYTKVLEFFMENGISLNEEQIKSLKEGFFNKSKKKDTIKQSTDLMKYTAEKVTVSKFDYLYNTEAMCAEGFKDADKDETHKAMAEHISKTWTDVDHNKTIKFYYCTGKDVNNYYHLTGDNKYPGSMGFLFIDCKALDNYNHKGNFRWFADVIDNNARREILKGNPYYKNYHSLYGDKWFYQTVENMKSGKGPLG